MIDVTAQYFAVFREQAGCDDEQIETTAANAGELFGEIARRHGFLDTVARCKVAVNGDMAGWDTQIRDSDVILFFPPVAGG